jgi:hypothetical protein
MVKFAWEFYVDDLETDDADRKVWTPNHRKNHGKTQHGFMVEEHHLSSFQIFGSAWNAMNVNDLVQTLFNNIKFYGELNPIFLPVGRAKLEDTKWEDCKVKRVKCAQHRM